MKVDKGTKYQISFPNVIIAGMTWINRVEIDYLVTSKSQVLFLTLLSYNNGNNYV